MKKEKNEPIITPRVRQVLTSPCGEINVYRGMAEQYGLDPDKVTPAEILAHSMVIRAIRTGAELQTVLDRVDGVLAKTQLIGGAEGAAAVSFRFAEAVKPSDRDDDPAAT